MKIIITENAKEYIKSKTENITIDVEGCASWGVGEPQPVVQLAAPKLNKDDYDVYDVDGIKTYVLCTINAKDDTLTVDLKKVLFSKKLIISGIQF